MTNDTGSDARQSNRYFDAPASGTSPPHFQAHGAAGDTCATGSNDAASGDSRAAPFRLREFTAAGTQDDPAALDRVRDVELDVKIELGRAEMALEDVLKLRPGAVVLLDKLAGDLVDVVVNGRLVARGEVVVLDDNFCVRVVELVAAADAA